MHRDREEQTFHQQGFVMVFSTSKLAAQPARHPRCYLPSQEHCILPMSYLLVIDIVQPNPKHDSSES